MMVTSPSKWNKKAGCSGAFSLACKLNEWTTSKEKGSLVKTRCFSLQYSSVKSFTFEECRFANSKIGVFLSFTTSSPSLTSFQLCCCLDGFNYSSDSKFLLPLCRPLSKCSIDDGYNNHYHVQLLFFSVLLKGSDIFPAFHF